jgi:dTDP-4-amino-4,6-dideoxygalactose transaminase
MIIPAAKIHFPKEDRIEVSKRIDEILASGQLTLGKYGKEFEEQFARYIGTKYAVAVNSGTSALEIPLRVMDVKDRSVIVPTNTFFATPAAVIHAGGKVRFADCTDNLCIDPDAVNEEIDGTTRAVIAVHIGGAVVPGIREIREICDDHGLFLLEDAAHAHGSTLDSRHAGAFGHAAAFSFYPTKVMTSGEGGMITTDDPEIHERAMIFRDQGKAGFLGNIHTEMGYNWRLSEVHAAIGLSQFGRLEEFIRARRIIARFYDEAIKTIPALTPLPVSRKVNSNYYKYSCMLNEGYDRGALKQELKQKHGVSLSGEVYELPCHMQPVFRDLGGTDGREFPVAEKICRQHICLPVYATMTREEAEYVIQSLKDVLT